MGFIIGLLRPIAQWILAEVFAKILLHIKDAYETYKKNKEIKARQEAAIKKHKELLEKIANKEEVSDEELAESFENALNSRDPRKP